MPELLRTRATALWLLLIALTVLSLEFFQKLGFGGDHRLGAAIVIVVAFIKVRIVGLEYMELRNAPLPLRLFFELWVAVILATILFVSLSQGQFARG
ncbi:hypothetical protein SFOMI_2755 [Sphingobium fuliginis]|uniref:Cytochrome C oxidase subunit IV n=2 Tax=Sphingobium fuliginis (strain ATCC 27551) TaxID=336203 RepID=A0A292ZH77_SPHSA|nr:hypothetical protein SFOMI_2755 [Sphingobium fuliginis]